MSGVDLGAGLRGWLDLPSEGERAGDTVQLRGWVLHSELSVEGIVARSHGQEWTLVHGLARPDVAAALPLRPDGLRSGFEGSIPLRPGPNQLTLHVRLRGGAEHRCFERTVVGGTPARRISGPAYLREATSRATRAWRDGRLELDPTKIVRHLRNLRRELEESGPLPSVEPPAVGLKDALTRLYERNLREFLSTGARLSFGTDDSPDVSVVLVLFNRAELTLRCLRSIAEVQGVRIELIVVDNASSDDTGALLGRLDGARILRNSSNEGFLLAVNRATALARGRHILLLNNDAELLPGALPSMLSTLESSPDIGAVTGRLILPDGSLQEAGSIIWRDGSCLGYGRGDDPQAPPYQFRREVDLASGALLLTPRAVWESLGGFDPLFAPAYYEDTDYSVRVWRSGRRVLYEPQAVAVHFEFASSPSRAHAIALQTKHRIRFEAKHRDWLGAQSSPDPTRALQARTHGEQRRMLVLDDRVPHGHLGAGFPRARAHLIALEQLGWQVSLLPLSKPNEAWPDVYLDVPRSVEVLTGVGEAGLRAHLKERAEFYDAVLVSRPHNMARLTAATQGAGVVGLPPIVYDAEAIFAYREAQERALRGTPWLPEELASRVRAEIALAEKASVVIATTRAEAAPFERPGRPAWVVGHAVSPHPTPAGHGERSGLLFVGALNEPGSPNVDSLCWFVREILPRLKGGMTLDVAGETSLPEILALRSDRVRLLGRVEDLRPLYNRARVFIAPTRFAAGLPYKVHHAAAHGVPVVSTSHLRAQLGWVSGRDLLTADSPEAFAAELERLNSDAALWTSLRDSALERVAQHCSAETFSRALQNALDAVQSLPKRPRK